LDFFVFFPAVRSFGLAFFAAFCFSGFAALTFFDFLALRFLARFPPFLFFSALVASSAFA